MVGHADRRRGGAGFIFSILWSVVLVVLGAATFGIWEIHREGPLTEATEIAIPKGAGVSAIASRLHSAGAIRSPLLFRIASELYAADGKLKAGDYEAEPGESMRALLEKIENGKMRLHAVRVPEGLTSEMIVEIVAAHPMLDGEVGPVPAEGALLPETYLVPRGMARAEVIARMAKAHEALLTELWAKRAKDLPITTPREAVILASVVEKETGVASERPRVAAVFVNRLRKGMRLESDPTIIYGLTKGRSLGRGIRRSELDRVTPYNTYQIDGLPPTPIANPGKAALEAVLNPPATNELFFVADGTGGHAFAETVEAHNANVERWRALERAAAASAPAAP